MKKIFFVFLALSLLIPLTGIAAIVNCGNPGQKACTLDDLIGKNGVIYNMIDFVLTNVVTALAVIFLIIGAAVLIMSAGNPEKKSLGKKIIVAAVVGTALAYGAWAIVKFVLSLIGAKATV